jgi:membrane protease YdiL (CAAX protease family)
MTMTNLETEELLVGKRSEFIPSETDGGSLDAEFIPAGETTLCRVSEVPLAGVSDELTETVQPTRSTTAEPPGNSTSIRWWDPLIIIVSAWLAWAMFWVLFGFVAGFYFAMRSGTDFDAFITAASQNFYVCQIANVSFYLGLFLAMRWVLRKRRGHGSFAGYFRPIGGRRLFYAALSGLLAYGLALLVLSVFWCFVRPQYQPTVAHAVARPRSLGHLAVFGLICVVLAPLAEEMLFRGLLLEWLQLKLGRLSAASLDAAIFALWHFRFLEHPGIIGWNATALIAAIGFICALWAQRTRSLRAPVATHATYNAAIALLFGP